MSREFSLIYEQTTARSPWNLPRALRSDEGKQRNVSTPLLAEPCIRFQWAQARLPYTWLPNHLADGRDQVSPKFAAALRNQPYMIYPRRGPIRFTTKATSPACKSVQGSAWMRLCAWITRGSMTRSSH